MPGGVRYADRCSVRPSAQSEPLQLKVVNQRCNIGDMGLQRQVIYLSLGRAYPPTVERHEQTASPQTFQEGAAFGTLPLQL
jgi:hypothetical protein